MRIVMAGASGLLGTALAERFRDSGHDVVRLVRRPPQAPDESQWDPDAGTVDPSVIESADVLTNTAGKSLVGNVHSKKWERTVRDSRIHTMTTLADAIAASGTSPAFLVSSGVAYYGDHGDQVVTEDSPSLGDAFLTKLTREWQAVAEPAAEAGARVCVLRTSPVATKSNPLFRLQLPLFRLGLAARMGSGKQYMPLISLRDWIGAVAHLAEHPTAAGAFNLCCPVTPTNAEFTKALAKALHRPAFLAAPAPILRLAAGPMAPEVLSSVNLRPAALVREGYAFQDADVNEVLRTMLSE
jgi:uncharacterized protein (TIGR01777 family)